MQESSKRRRTKSPRSWAVEEASTDVPKLLCRHNRRQEDDLACLDGETNPHGSDTDGDGLPDLQEGTFICNAQSPTNPFGLRPMKYVDSSEGAYPTSNWRLSLEPAAVEGVPAISNPTQLEAAYAFDMTTAG